MNVCMHVLGRARTDVRVLREATALREVGYSVSIVDVESESTRRGGANNEGVAIRHVVMPSWFAPTRFKPWFLFKALYMLVRSTLALAWMPADIYCAHDFDALPACYLVALVRRKRLVFDAHELPLVDPNVTSWPLLCSLYARALRVMVSRCAGVITVSPPIADDLYARFGASHVEVVRNIPPFQRVAGSSRLAKCLHVGPESRVALYQGNLQADRGLDVLVHAAPFLDPNVVIVMMGKGPLQAHLERLTVDLGCQDRVKIIPPVPYSELLSWTAAADLGLIVNPASYSRNVQLCLPNKLFEYLMAGLPVLTSRLVAVEDLIAAYGVGRIVDPLIPEVVGRAINALMRDDSARDTMRHNAHLATERELRWEVERGRLLDLYAQISGTTPRRPLRTVQPVVDATGTVVGSQASDVVGMWH